MKDKILTEKEILQQVTVENDFFQQMVKRNLIKPKGTADGDVLIFGQEAIGRINEIKQFISMGYSLE